jgi:hypothetical protein
MRLTLAFPGCNTIVVKKQLARIDGALRSMKADSLKDFISSALPDEDGSFHWSDVGAGVCNKIEDALDELFDRFVSSSEGKYGALEDLSSSWPALAVGRATAYPHWTPMPHAPASNEEWQSEGAIAAGGSNL